MLTKDVRSYCSNCRKNTPVEDLGHFEKGDFWELKKKCLICKTISITSFPVIKKIFVGKK